MPQYLPTRRNLLQLAPGFLLAAPARAGSDTVPEIAYYSDYYSFVGRDDKGYVFVAHDNNRGRDRDSYQANHFVAMYDEATGWVDLKGNVVYPNKGKVLDGLPPSEHFSFEGRASTGTIILGREGGFRLAAEPLPQMLRRENEDGIFWIGAAPGALEWNGRRLVGRVIFEYLQRHNFNYFTSKADRSWRNFNGLYLMTEDGRDLYIHSHERQGGSDLTGRLVGMASWGTPAPVTELTFRIVETAAVAYRTYRWPIAWRAGFVHDGASHVLELFTAERKLCGDWETGGFAMSVARGTLISEGGAVRRSVIGWAELLI